MYDPKLLEETVTRLESGIYPYFQERSGWRIWPPSTAEFLRKYEPIHLISISMTDYTVDGKTFHTSASFSEKIETAEMAVKKVFAPISKPIFNRKTKGLALFTIQRLRASRKPFYSIRLEEGFHAKETQHTICILELHERVTNQEAHHYLICASKPLARFAVLFTAQSLWSEGYLLTYKPQNNSDKCLLAFVEDDKGFKVAPGVFTVSLKFFNEPNAQNARYFGDLLLLTQNKKHWKVTSKIQVPHNLTGLSWPLIRKVLPKMVGYHALANTAAIQLLIAQNRLEEAFWRIIGEAETITPKTFAEYELLQNRK